MLEKQRELSKTELQVASGKRILNPSDDPASRGPHTRPAGVAAATAQYQRNADVATAKLDQEETALLGMENLLQRVRELAVQGNNDPDRCRRSWRHRGRDTPAHRQLPAAGQLRRTPTVNTSLPAFRARPGRSATTASATSVTTATPGQRMLKIGDSREVAIGDPGSVFMDFAAAGGGTTNVGEVLYDLASNLEAGNADPDALTDIDTALTGLLNTRAKVGARMNAIDDQKERERCVRPGRDQGAFLAGGSGLRGGDQQLQSAADRAAGLAAEFHQDPGPEPVQLPALTGRTSGQESRQSTV